MEVRTFLRRLQAETNRDGKERGKEGKRGLTVEDLLTTLQGQVEGVTQEDVADFIASVSTTGQPNATLTEKDLRVFLEQMGF